VVGLDLDLHGVVVIGLVPGVVAGGVAGRCRVGLVLLSVLCWKDYDNSIWRRWLVFSLLNAFVIVAIVVSWSG
jgi:hypothetical protein